jgi:hypothetical protein
MAKDGTINGKPAKIYHAERRDKNRTKVRAANKKYDENNRAKRRANGAAYRAKYPEKIKAYSKLPSRREIRAAHQRKFLAKLGGFAECVDFPPQPTDSKCAICHREAVLCVDHDHETGKFRGYICRECNLGLGKLGDSIEAIQRVLRYLTENLDA